MNGSRFTLSSRLTTIGRGAEADCQLHDPAVSSRHAAIRLGGSASIEDLGSTNGTFVDGRRVSSADLRDGAVISLGGVKVTFHAG
jgi:pSer/pThr/pTyr-binding forkhead associated (FHA) protein